MFQDHLYCNCNNFVHRKYRNTGDFIQVFLNTGRRFYNEKILTLYPTDIFEVTNSFYPSPAQKIFRCAADMRGVTISCRFLAGNSSSLSFFPLPLPPYPFLLAPSLSTLQQEAQEKEKELPAEEATPAWTLCVPSSKK